MYHIAQSLPHDKFVIDNQNTDIFFPHSKHSPKNGLILYRAFAGSTLTDFPLIFTFFMAFNTSFPYSCGTSTNV